MSGSVKAGLIFGLIGIVATVAVNFIFAFCSPVVAAIIGGLAGYFGVRWSVPPAGVGKGVLAGTIAGVLMLVASVIFFVVFINIMLGNPQFADAINQVVEQQQQQGGQQLTPDQLSAALSFAGPIAGFCFGLINLLASLALGAAGGAIAARNTQAPPTYQPPIGPPPMTPGQ